MTIATTLHSMIEEATAGRVTHEEQAWGLFAMLDRFVELPFRTEVLGVEVRVMRLELDAGDHAMALCQRGDGVMRIPLQDLPLPKPAPRGSEWIAAWRRWQEPA